VPHFADSCTEHTGDSPFNPNALEAIATVFALDVPSLALLVIPASGPVKRAVYELRALGVEAYPFDVTKKKRGREHLLRSPTDPSQTMPTLLVTTLSNIRGVDLPDLTHVFVLGLPRKGEVDTYLHVAGRVGRFWRGGKVISILEEAEGVKDETSRMNSIFKRLDITPTQLEHFD
jgi:superfamily II DNA/RNA helicase